MKDPEAFDGTRLSDILKDIHDNAHEKRNNINGVIKQLVGLIKDANDAIMLAPLIHEFYDVGIKSDEHLVKIATIVQRVVSAEAYEGSSEDGGTYDLTDAEKDRLIKNATSELKADVKETDIELQNATKKLNDHAK